MKINQNFLLWVALSVVSIVFFQNCGQQGDIALKMEDDSSDTLIQDICSVNPEHVRCTNAVPVGKVEEYRYIDVTQPVIPDLKIFLVFDNSDSMRASQINLVNNIEKMFTVNGEGLKDYNSEIFIITTAQLNNISNSLFRANIDAKNDYQKVIEKIKEANNAAYILSLIEVFRPGGAGLARKTSGLLEGDMVGFKLKTVRTPATLGTKYDALNVDFFPAYLTHFEQPSIVSVKYAKGESIQELVDRIKARVEFLDPDKQFLSRNITLAGNIVDNIPLSDVVEKESGLCAMARVLHEVKNNPDNSLIKKGELATFILVSDEREHDPEGLECVKSYKFQQPVPGWLYKGECADTESRVEYKIPSTKTVNYRVQLPYTKHIRQAYESIQDEITERYGSCQLKYNQSLVRLNVKKNTHVVTFDRKVVDTTSGDRIVDFYNHNFKFDRISRKFSLTFDRTTLKHKVMFTRTTKKYALAATRTKTSPKYPLNVSRKKVAKYQLVNFVRKTILTKEGGQQQTVDTYSPAAPIRVSNVNYATPSECTVSWLRSLQSVSSVEVALNNPALSYQYTISSCVVNNDETPETKSATVYTTKPTSTNCNETLAKAVFPEGTLATNESYTYNSITCGTETADTATSTLGTDISGDKPADADCNSSLAGSKDTALLGKPTIDTTKNETLVYTGISCNQNNLVQTNQKKENLDGEYAATNLLEYIVSVDGNLGVNVLYTDLDKADTPSTAVGVATGNINGVYPSATPVNEFVKTWDGSKPFTRYTNAALTVGDTTASNQALNGRANFYNYTDDARLILDIRSADGNKSNTDYANVSYENIPTYKEKIGYTVTVNGKTKSVSDCTTAYAQSIDNAVPAITAGQSIVYSNPSCSVTSTNDFTIARGATTIQYNGSYGNRAISYDSSLGATAGTATNCTAEKRTEYAALEQTDYPEFNIDGNILEWPATGSCKIYNSESTGNNTTKTNILNAINNSTLIRNSATVGDCTTAIATHCTNNSANNPGNLYGCENVSGGFVTYRAPKAEFRKYTLKPPVKVPTADELQWFGFNPLSIRDKNNANQVINLLVLKCSDVPGACVDATSADDATLVQDYFKRVYAGNDGARWTAFVKTALADTSIVDSTTLTACNETFMATYQTCRNLSIPANSVISYDTVTTDVPVTVGIDTAVSCDDTCTTDSCKTKSGYNYTIPIAGKKVKDFYNQVCAIGTITKTGEATRYTDFVQLAAGTRDLTAYQEAADVCNLTCADSGLCKVGSNTNATTSTVKQYIAGRNLDIDSSNVTSCKIKRKVVASISGKRSVAELDNACIRPANVLLPTKYVRAKEQYYDADPSANNEVKLVKENESNLENYIKSGFTGVLGEGYVSMIAFASQTPGLGGLPEGSDYNRVAASVNGQVRDVKASSTEYGDALKFLGEKVAAQLASSFKVSDVASSQQITRVWYSSWFTKGKFIELKPTEFSTSANSFVITNPDIVNKMKNEAAFKFFVEIY